MATIDVMITLCGDGSYCCGQNNTACCQGDQGVWISAGKVYPYTSYPFTSSTTSTSSASSSTSSSTATSNPSPAQLTNSSCHGDCGDTKKIALGVGLGVGIPVLILMASVLFLLFSRNIRAAKNNATDGQTVVGHNVFPKYSGAQPATHGYQESPAALTPAVPRSELEAGQ